MVLNPFLHRYDGMVLLQKTFFWLVLIFSLSQSTIAFAEEEDEKALAKAALNALKINKYSDRFAMPFQEYLNFDYGNNNTQSILYFKPVVPIRLAPDYDLIIRTIAPLYERTPTHNTQNVLDGHYIGGWGDLNPTFFVAPIKIDSIVYGFGPSLSIPTSTNSHYIGTGKWSIGPELAFYFVPENWQIGFLTYNLWSIGGDPKKPSVNTFEFQYLISYFFDKGWYIASNPTITANWKSPGNQQWTVPFGIGGGRTFKQRSHSMNMNMYANYNVIRPAQVGPNWQLVLEVEWLFKGSF